MSLVTWTKKNSRAMGKLALYGTGGVLIGMPVISFGSNLWKGMGVQDSIDHALDDNFGIYGMGTKVDQTKLRNGAFRTGLGVLAILAARKI